MPTFDGQIEETMDDEGNEALPMDSGPENPELVDEPRLQDEPDPEPEKVEQPRSPDGKFASKGTGVAEQSDAATPADNPIPDDQFKGYLTEKRKRQELEQQVASMQQQIAAMQSPAQAPAEFWDNPEGFMAQRFDQFGEQLLQRFQQQQMTQRMDASEAAAMKRHPDYQDALAAFRQATMADPSLAQQMAMASDPAEFAYQHGKTAVELSKVGSMDALEKQLRAKWEAELKAAAPSPSFPVSTASDGSVATRSGPVWTGPVNDRDILPMG